MYDYSDYYDYSSTPTFNPLPTIISLVLCVFVLVCMWIIFRKAGKPGWAAIVPFYNLYVLFDITWGSGMRFLLMLIPLYNIILGIQTQIRLAKAFGKSGGFAAGLIFLPYVFIPSRGISSPSSPSMPLPPSSRSMLRRSSPSSIQRPSSHSSLPLSSLSPSSRRRRPALPLFAPAAERRATVRNSARTAVRLCADPSCHSWTE